MGSTQRDVRKIGETARNELHRILSAIRGLDPHPIAADVLPLARALELDVAGGDCALCVGFWRPPKNDSNGGQQFVEAQLVKLFPELLEKPPKHGVGHLLINVDDGSAPATYLVVWIDSMRSRLAPFHRSPMDAYADVVVVGESWAQDCERWRNTFEAPLAPRILVVSQDRAAKRHDESIELRHLVPAPLQFRAAIRDKYTRRLNWYAAMAQILKWFLTREQCALRALDQQLGVRLGNLRDLRKRANSEKAATIQSCALALDSLAAKEATRIEDAIVRWFELDNADLVSLREKIENVGDTNQLITERAVGRFNKLGLKKATKLTGFCLDQALFDDFQDQMQKSLKDCWWESAALAANTPLRKAVVALDELRSDTTETFRRNYKGYLPEDVAHRAPSAARGLSEASAKAVDALFARLSASLSLVKPRTIGYEGRDLFTFIGAIKAGVMQWTMPFTFLFGAIVGGIAIADPNAPGGWVKGALAVVGTIGAMFAIREIAVYKKEARGKAAKDFRRQLEEQSLRCYDKTRSAVRGNLGKILATHSKELARTVKLDLDDYMRELEAAAAEREKLLQYRKDIASRDQKLITDLQKKLVKLTEQLEECTQPIDSFSATPRSPIGTKAM